jgi:ADP-heptose:LPS heptosyltransferase
LRYALPEAELTLIGMPFVKELVERSPHLDRFIPFPGFLGMAEQFFDARTVTAFFQQMQAEQFDLAIQMHGSGVYSNPFTLMLGTERTVGFVRNGDPGGRLDTAIPFPETEHEIRRVLTLTTFLGAAPQGEQTEFPLWPSDRESAKALLNNFPTPFIGLHPSARETSKQWSLDRFIAVGRALQQKYGGTILIVGGQDEWPQAEQVAQGIGRNAVNLAGKTSLATLGAAITHFSLLITNDSGPAHIAYALNVPTVTLFGSTDPDIWGPLNWSDPIVANRHRVLVERIPCHPCNQATCDIGYDCLNRITVQHVLENAEGAIASSVPVEKAE